MAPVLSKEFLDIQANYRVWIHSETRTWHENNIQLSVFVCFFIHRQPRHHKWRMNYADNDNHDQFTTTQATTVTTTKSPEQIIKEKEAIIYSVTLKE